MEAERRGTFDLQKPGPWVAQVAQGTGELGQGAAKVPAAKDFFRFFPDILAKHVWSLELVLENLTILKSKVFRRWNCSSSSLLVGGLTWTTWTLRHLGDPFDIPRSLVHTFVTCSNCQWSCYIKRNHQRKQLLEFFSVHGPSWMKSRWSFSSESFRSVSSF